MAIRGAGRGSGAMVGVVGWFLTHFVRPFSIAHLLGRAGGIWISFLSLARLASCLFSLIRICVARIVSVPWKRCGEGVVAWGDTPRLVGGVILASRPSSRPLVSLCGSFDFPVSACGQDACAVFVSSFSCVIPWRLVVSFSFSSRPSFRLPVSCGRLVSILCGSLIYPFHLVDLSASRRSVLRLVFSSRFAVRLLRLVLSVSFGVSSSSPCSFVSSGRLVSTARRAGRVLRLVLFFFHCICPLCLMTVGTAAARLSHLVAACSRSYCLQSWNSIWRWRWRKWACRSTIRRNAPFYSARFPHQGGE